MRINPDRIIGFIVIFLALASGIILILISNTYREKLDLLWRRYDDPDLARRLALVLGIALIVGSILFFCSSVFWLCIFDSAAERKKRKYRRAQQRKMARHKSSERQSSEQSNRSAIDPTEVRNLTASPEAPPGAGGGRVTPSCPPQDAAMEVHDPPTYGAMRGPLPPPPYESVIMQECLKFPFVDEV